MLSGNTPHPHQVSPNHGIRLEVQGLQIMSSLYMPFLEPKTQEVNRSLPRRTHSADTGEKMFFKKEAARRQKAVADPQQC